MKTAHIYDVMTRWYNFEKEEPKKSGWYRVRTEPLSGAWWNHMAYFDGRKWWQLGQFLIGNGPHMGVRRQLTVLQWQGLRMAPAEAAKYLRAHLPKTPAVRQKWMSFIAILEAEPEIPAP